MLENNRKLPEFERKLPQKMAKSKKLERAKQFTYQSGENYPAYLEIACPHKFDEEKIYIRPADWRETFGRFVQQAISAEYASGPELNASQTVWHAPDAADLREKIFGLLDFREHPKIGDHFYLVFNRKDFPAVLELAARTLSLLHVGQGTEAEKEFLAPALERATVLPRWKVMANSLAKTFNIASSFKPEPFRIEKPLPPEYWPPPPC